MALGRTSHEHHVATVDQAKIPQRKKTPNMRPNVRRDIEKAPGSRAIRFLGCGWVSADYRRRAPSLQLRPMAAFEQDKPPFRVGSSLSNDCY